MHQAQAGTYEIAGNAQHVLFWHIHNGHIVSYDIAGIPPWWASLSDLWKEGLNQRGEQFFIRISSNLAIEEALRTNVLNQTVKALGSLALYATPNG